MCRSKPGPRCWGHANASVKSAHTRLTQARAALKDAQDRGATDTRIAALQERTDTAQAVLREAVRDSDATRTGRTRLATKLADPGLSKSKKTALTTRLTHAQALAEARRRHLSAMPPGTPMTDVAATHLNSLGKARDLAARLEAEAAVASPKDRAVIQARLETVQTDAFRHDFAYRMANSRSTPDVEHLLPREQQAWRKATPEQKTSLALLSHQRAAIAGAGHPDRYRDWVEARAAKLHEQLWPGQPPPAPLRNTRTATDGRASRGRGRGRRMTPERMFTQLRGNVTPGAQLGKEVGFLPADVSR